MKNAEELKSLTQFAHTKNQVAALNALIANGTIKSAAKSLGCSYDTVKKRIQRLRRYAAKRGWSPEHDHTHVVPPGYAVKGTSTLWDKDGNLVVQWVKSDRQNDDAQEAMRIFAEEMCDEFRGAFKFKGRKPKESSAPLASAFVIGDAHLGLYAYAKETGSEDQDLAGACDDILSGISNLIDRSHDCNEGILVNVGDWFHANTKVPLTPASGNLLDVDSRFGKVARAGSELQREAINMLLQKFPTVTLINAKGNHDPDAAMWLNMLAEAIFEGHQRVHVVNNSMKFLHHQVGHTALFVYHGERNTNQQYEYVTSAFRNEYGMSKHAYVLNGHRHHTEVKEVGGIVFETFNSLIAKDAYHADGLYTAARSMTNITYHHEYGEVGRNRFDIRMCR